MESLDVEYSGALNERDICNVFEGGGRVKDVQPCFADSPIVNTY